jgi:hypothetical protein
MVPPVSDKRRLLLAVEVAPPQVVADETTVKVPVVGCGRLSVMPTTVIELVFALDSVIVSVVVRCA